MIFVKPAVEENSWRNQTTLVPSFKVLWTPPMLEAHASPQGNSVVVGWMGNVEIVNVGKFFKVSWDKQEKQ